MRREREGRAAEGVSQAQGEGAVLPRQPVCHLAGVVPEVRPAVGPGALGLRRVAVSARVHGEDAEVRAQPGGHLRPHRGAEAVGVVQQRGRSLAAEVDQRDADSGVQVLLSMLVIHTPCISNTPPQHTCLHTLHIRTDTPPILLLHQAR